MARIALRKVTEIIILVLIVVADSSRHDIIAIVTSCLTCASIKNIVR